MRVVFFDAATGRIIQLTDAIETAIKADGRPYVELADDHPPMPDLTHRVIDGQVVPKDDDTLARERQARLMADLRQMRNALLSGTVDAMNPMRWAELTVDQQAAWQAYRKALLDLPSHADPANPVWPTPPSP